MNLLYTVDNNFVPQLAANICSVVSNHSGIQDITFHVFSNGITEDNQHLLQEVVAKYNQNLAFYDISNFKDALGFDCDTSGWNEIVLARLLMAHFLPNEIERVIYLDGDTIVLGDIALLWNQDLKGCVVGMVPEPTVGPSRLNDLDLNGCLYHNAGVLLVDLKQWRSTCCEDQLLDYCERRSGRLFANDQDALNAVLKDKICSLSPVFNYSNIFDYYPYLFLNSLMPGFSDENNFNTARLKPIVVHYLGEERPWRRGNTHRFNNEYHFYLSETFWKDAKDEDGWGAYFLAWRTFNFLTRPFPQLRYKVISGLIPAFLKYRASKRNK